MQRQILEGSERKTLPGATLRGPANPAERLEVTVILRRHAAASLQARVERLHRGDHSLAPLTRDEFAASHGAMPSDIAAVERFAALHHLVVVSTSAARRTVVLSGTVTNFEGAFGVKLLDYDHPSGAYRGRQGGVILPAALTNIVVAVLGLDNRPQAQPYIRSQAAGAAPAAAVSYAPTKVASLYDFPAGTGTGETIGIIELGGGSRAADLKTYFNTLGLAAPKLVSVSVDHGRNHATGSASGPDGEVMLDIEVAGAVAPGAKLAVYFAPNTDAGFLDAVTTAVHDNVNKPSVISISWGGPETAWTAQAIAAFDQVFQEAATLGVTICIASGDNGSKDTVNDGANHVNFPASSPHVLACGGTSLQSSGNAITRETVWNDGVKGGASGGGISAAFPSVPSWQAGLSAALTDGTAKALSGRGVPDVAGDADPQTGYQVRVDGKDTVIGGTSAVAPLWAGLIARINAARSTPVGFINPLLYQNAGAFNDIIAGNNGAFAAAKGWDACTGLGSPQGAALAKLLAAVPDQGKSAQAAPQSGSIHYIKQEAFMAGGEKTVSADGKIKDEAFMGRGDKVAPGENKTGKVKDEAFMGRGDKPAGGGGKAAKSKIKDEAFMGRG